MKILNNELVKEKQNIIRELDVETDKSKIDILKSRLLTIENQLKNNTYLEEKMEEKKVVPQTGTKKLIVKADVLKSFIEKTTVSGLISDCLLKFEANGLNVANKDMPGIVAIQGFLDKSVFNTYSEMELKVKSSKNLIDALATFKDKVINIVKENNMIRLQDENGGFDFVESEDIACKLESMPEISYDGFTVVSKTIVNDILGKNRIIKDGEIIVEITNKQLFFKVGKEVDKAEVKITCNDDKDKMSKFNIEYFEKVLGEVDSVFDMYLDSEKPMKVNEKTDKYNIVYYVCPMSLVD